MVVVFLGSNSVWAQSAEYKKPVSKRKKKNGDKLDISGLKKKYWAPKDTDFTVVQSRTYSKSKRLALSLLFGPAINNGYSSGFASGAVVNYYFSERHGVELSYVNYDLSHNDVVAAFLDDSRNTSAKLPDHGKVRNYYSIGYNWVPIYAKISLLGSRILYFDFAVTPSIGMLTYEQMIKSGDAMKEVLMVGLDVSQHYFINKSFAVRIDFKNSWSKQEVMSWQLGTFSRTLIVNETTLMVGLTYYF